MFIVDRIRLHVSTLKGSSSGLLFVSNRRPDDDPLRVETCCLLLSTINIDVLDVLIIFIFAITITHRDV